MNAEYINPFLRATTLVFNEVLGLRLIRGKTTIKKNPAPERDIAILIEVKGHVSGDVIYAMNIETIYKIVRKQVPEISSASMDNEYRDIIGELANMITGNALNIFLSSNTELEISVPVVMDTRLRGFKLKDRKTLGLCLYSHYGLLEVNIALSAKN